MSRQSLVKKCNEELEVHYTKLLTREFCLQWIFRVPLTSETMGVLMLDDKQGGFQKEQPNKLYLLVTFRTPSDDGYHSLRRCSVIALDIEYSLLSDLQRGNGCCTFVE